MEHSGFFNAVKDNAGNYDRVYKAEDFAAFFNSLLTNGVFPNPSTNLQVISNNNMTVTLKTGKAWINGYVYINDSDLILTVDPADGVLNRIDRLVLKMDRAGRAINAVIKKGTFASSPIAPSLQRDADGYELGIADIAINAGVTSISQANITDLRLNTSYCGIVNSLIQADTTTLFNQYQDWYKSQQNKFNVDLTSYTTDKQNEINIWYSGTKTNTESNVSTMEQKFQSDFNTWFNGIKSQLGDAAATSLQNEINDLSGSGRTIETVKGNADNIAALSQTVSLNHNGVINLKRKMRMGGIY